MDFPAYSLCRKKGHSIRLKVKEIIYNIAVAEIVFLLFLIHVSLDAVCLL